MANSSVSNKPRPTRSLRRSLLLNLTATTLIPLLILTVAVLYYLTERAAEDVAGQNLLLARAISGQIEAFLHAPEASLFNLRNLHLTHKNSLSSQNYQEILDSLTESSPLIESIYILDHQGQITEVGLAHKNDNLRSEFMRLQLGHQKFIKQAWQQQKPVWSDTFLSIITGKTSLSLAVPANDRMIVGNISIDQINSFLLNLHQEEQIESTIVDRQGEIIASSRQSPNGCPSNLRNLSLIRDAKEKGERTASYRFQGKLYLGSVAQIKSPGWLTLVAQTSDNAYQPVRRTSLFFLSAIFITLAVTFLVVFITSKRIIAPIKLFSNQARALAEGDYDRQQLTPVYSEIATLADDFQHMARRIAERETALTSSEEAYRTLAENLPAIVYRLHIRHNNHLQFMNSEYLHMTGFDSDHFTATDGCPFENMIHPDDHSNFVNTLRGAIHKHRPFSQEYRFKHADGEYRTFFEKGCPVFDKNDEVSHIDGVIFDITERKRAEEIILQSEKMLSVGGLAAGMAHEINNPLAGILQNCQLIRRRLNATLTRNLDVAETTKIDLKQLQHYLEQRNILQMLDAIRDSGQRAAKIVENILDFSRKSQKDFSLQNLPELIEKTLDLARSDYDFHKDFDFRNIEIICHHEQNLPEVHCDPAQIQQVLLNIFKNGAQAMSEQDDHNLHQFQICTYQQQDMVYIEITDNGPGMPSAIQKRIFEPFFTTKKVGKGTGLGLSVCYFIIAEKHHGSMKVSSTPGQGTKFTIGLPLQISTE